MFIDFGHACVSDEEDWGRQGDDHAHRIKGDFVVSGPDGQADIIGPKEALVPDRNALQWSESP